MELLALPAWFRLDQGWLSVFGLLLDALGFGLIAFEWFRGYIEMRAKTRIDYWERERTQKRKLRQEHRDMLAMTGVPEIAPVLENQEYLDDAAESAREEARLLQFQRSRAWLCWALKLSHPESLIRLSGGLHGRQGISGACGAVG